MKYYKLIQNNEIIGIATSNDFMEYLQHCDCYSRADENSGEYVSCNGKFYRDDWMQPAQHLSRYENATIISISQAEYEIFRAAIISNQTIPTTIDDDEPETIEPPENIDPVVVSSLEYIRDSKISEMSLQCRKTIEAGVDVELRMETKHFSMDTQDQLNLMSLGVMAQTQELIPYHADGETCIFYTADEINQIVAAATAHKVYHTTYYNALKNYINSLSTIEEIAAITYGTPIPDEYQSEVLKVITQ